MSLALQVSVIALAILVSLGWAGLRCVRALHMLQLDSYANGRLLAWLRAHPTERALDVAGALLHGFCIAALLAPPLAMIDATLWLGAWGLAGAALVGYRLRTAERPKKPLVYTSRAIRILTLSLGISLAVVGFAAWFGLTRLSGSEAGPVRAESALALLLASLVVIQLAPLSVVVANLLLVPVQRTINRTYLRRAKRKLSEVRPLVVGITGSYGKTSTKYFLERLMAPHRTLLKTPLSYNTLMGVCRVINEELKPEHQIFVVEMGAYRRGDIRELCEFVHPSLGILTAIGPQHLERFKTIDNVQAAKYELIEALPTSGVAILNHDDPRCRALADRATHLKVLRYGLETTQQPLDLWAEGVRMGPEGLSFRMCAKERGGIDVQTVLLGRHNVLNILGASCAAMALGLSLAELAKAIRNLPPVPHRLQLLHGDGGVTVIDDSYNSNPVGAREALAVLGSFTAGRRILVTPGMVELGPLETELNEQLGEHAADVCHHVVLVGPEQTRPLQAGLRRKRFPPERMHVVADLSAATEALAKIVQAGDTVLFENDLPDLYR